MKHLLHIEDQQSSLCRGLLHIYQGCKTKTTQNLSWCRMNFHLSSNWPGDRPSSMGGGEKDKKVEEQSTTRKETASPDVSSTRGNDESEPKPLKTQYIISSDDDEED